MDRFEKVVAALKKKPGVTHRGKGFGSAGLKVKGKLFAFVSSRGQYVVKLPRDQVAELVGSGKGEFFDPGHGRLMKEWIAVTAPRADWVALARDAYRFVRKGV
jgi:hypothetical protein